MTQKQAFALLLLGLSVVTGALTWHFGWLGLLVPGAVITLYAFTVDAKDPIEVKEVNEFE
jgi:hypothetical protein